MTAAERQELGKLVRLNAKVAKDDADARGKWLLADAEAKLAARYKLEDEAWSEITSVCEKAVAEADALVAERSRELGIPEDFRPRLHLGWLSRGENGFKERRAELRKVAQTQVAARVKEAQVEIDREAARQLTEITRAGLTSEQAKAFIEAMPTPAELLPPLGVLQLHSGELVQLDAPVTGVTPNGLAVTPTRNTCACCGEPFTPNRRDGKYCRPACRVADYRKRQAEGNRHA